MASLFLLLAFRRPGRLSLVYFFKASLNIEFEAGHLEKRLRSPNYCHSSTILTNRTSSNDHDQSKQAITRVETEVNFTWYGVTPGVSDSVREPINAIVNNSSSSMTLCAVAIKENYPTYCVSGDQNSTCSSVASSSQRLPLGDEKQNSLSLASKIATIISSQSNRSPILPHVSSGQKISSDPQPSSASQSSSPCPSRNEPSNFTPQQATHGFQRHTRQELAASSNTNLISDQSAPFERRYSLQGDKPLNSPQRTTSIKPDQVLRNFVSVLSHVVDRRDRLSMTNFNGTNNRTPPVNPTPRSQQPSVANLLSSILGTHTKPSDGRPLTNALSPTPNRSMVNGLDKTKSERTPTCPPSSDGASIIISPLCPRSSPSPANTSASDFRNHPQKRPSPLEPSSVGIDVQHHRRARSSDVDGTAVAIAAAPTGNRHFLLALDSPGMLKFVDPVLTARFQHPVADSLESEAQSVLRNFDRLHSVLYSELSGELKKLRALVGISETKLKIHQKRKESLQQLMNAIESRRALPSLSSPDPVV
uniref:BLOC-1-related complex subunit 5 n=1 Tax=Mesocestoides corti TaxID=53468 RepID=A0A5K3ETL2_MESCO